MKRRKGVLKGGNVDENWKDVGPRLLALAAFCDALWDEPGITHRHGGILDAVECIEDQHGVRAAPHAHLFIFSDEVDEADVLRAVKSHFGDGAAVSMMPISAPALCMEHEWSMARPLFDRAFFPLDVGQHVVMPDLVRDRIRDSALSSDLATGRMDRQKQLAQWYLRSSGRISRTLAEGKPDAWAMLLV